MEFMKCNGTLYSQQLSSHWFMTNWLHTFQQYSARRPSASLAPETNSFSQLWSREKFFTMLPLPWLNLPFEKRLSVALRYGSREQNERFPFLTDDYIIEPGKAWPSSALPSRTLISVGLTLSLSSSHKRWVIKPVLLAIHRLTHINKSAQWKPINVWGNQRPFR